jgi:hypothetical protein
LVEIPLGKFIKREVRLNPGAIPVAVNTPATAKHFLLTTTVNTGRSRNGVEPEDLPDALFNHELSGEKPEMFNLYLQLFISVHIRRFIVKRKI